MHRIARRKFKIGDVFNQLFIVAAYILPTAITQALTWRQKGKLALWLAGIHVCVQIARQYRDLNPRAWDDAREHYVDRKLEFASVVRRLASGDPAQIDHVYTRDCLWLIANYVRAWRWDLGAKQIFASLLVEDTDDPDYLVVIARDVEGHSLARGLGKRYRKEDRLISECFETGKVREISNLRVESSNVDPNCPYASILGLPLKDASGVVIAVVSVDSSLPYHFAMEGDLLEGYLQPYLEALRPSVELLRRMQP